ncbi:hypothetical protein AQUCO_05300133v1 [Aquilegia coerulea]|uniref:Uncharacterized protein n=1 Tax=Aquilegia coerulea TaxID=218851 RepID=A0A2G5CIH8_AQUCA|nr:hypothetical protein AQUCO_05300133v1 [Aquilegia coerulea]
MDLKRETTARQEEESEEIFDDDDGTDDTDQQQKQYNSSGNNRESLSIEKIFDNKEVPAWQDQLTFRAFVVSLVLAILFTFIVMKLNLTTGIIPSLNVSAGLLGFFFVKSWTKFMEKSGYLKQPFTRQENTVIQTCVVASSGIAFSGGFGSYLFGMSDAIAKQSTIANNPFNIQNPSLGWIIGFLFVVSFTGLFSVVPLRKIMIIDYKLIYPSGTATAHLINSFHTPQGAKLAKKQVKVLGKFFSFSFLWGFFQWFFTAGDNCGFANFPFFGLEAFDNKFYFDFSATYVGVGMICPYLVNISLLVGGIISWGIMWPLIENKKGDWYPADLPPGSLQGLQGYKVFIAIALILGDGLYNFFKVLSQTGSGLIHQLRQPSSNELPIADRFSKTTNPNSSYDEERRTQLFLKDQIPTWFAVIGYVSIAVVSIITLPIIFDQLRCHIYSWSMGWRYTRWSASRACCMWSHDEHRLNSFGPHTRFQNWLSHPCFTKIHVYKPIYWDCYGLCNLPLCLLAFLQSIQGSWAAWD